MRRRSYNSRQRDKQVLGKDPGRSEAWAQVRQDIGRN